MIRILHKKGDKVRPTLLLLFLFFFSINLLIQGSVFAEQKKEAKKKTASIEERRAARDRAVLKSKKETTEGKDKTKLEKSDTGGDQGTARTIEDSPVVGQGGGSAANFDSKTGITSEIDAVLLLDSSGSMQRTDPQRLRDQAAKLFLRFLNEQDQVALISFDQEARTVLDLVNATPINLTAIDTALQGIANEGRFTDLQLPIQAALKLLQARGRKDAQPCVILLSDGQMDPFPTRGTKEAVTEELFKLDLPQFREQGIKIYSVSLSDQADRALLAKIANETSGSSWYAPDVDTIHLKFSDLFLVLKKPQVVPVVSGGFEIDSSVHEATFYITRKEVELEVTLISPKSEKINNQNLPIGYKWLRGEFFDVITIKGPTPGRWQLQGIENPEGFATLLTDLKLDVIWPETTIKAGESIAAFVRLTEGGKILDTPDIAEITFYTFKIVNMQSREVVASGSFHDDGIDGDLQAGDRIYSALIKMERPGEYRALIGVDSPTFSRQQQRPFTVTASLVSLIVEPADESSKRPERFVASVEKEARGLKNIELSLIIKDPGKNKSFILALTPLKDEEGRYAANTSVLAAGNYEVRAQLIGFDERRKKVVSLGEPLQYEAKTKESVQELQEVKEKTHLNFGPILLALGLNIAALGWAGALTFFAFTSFKPGKTTVDQVAPYSIPTTLAAQLEKLRKNTSQERREPNEEDQALQQALSEIVGARVSDVEKQEHPTTADASEVPISKEESTATEAAVEQTAEQLSAAEKQQQEEAPAKEQTAEEAPSTVDAPAEKQKAEEAQSNTESK